MKYTYLSIASAAEKLDFSVRYFREVVLKNSLIEGVHYVRPFGGRKILIIWEKVEEEMLIQTNPLDTTGIPMSAGGYCNG